MALNNIKITEFCGRFSLGVVSLKVPRNEFDGTEQHRFSMDFAVDFHWGG